MCWQTEPLPVFARQNWQGKLYFLYYWTLTKKISCTSCLPRRCSGIRAPLNFFAWLLWLRSTLSLRSCVSAQLCRLAPVAPLNFVASLLLAVLNFVASFPCSAHALNFVASLWSAQLNRLSIARSTHRKPRLETLFALNMCGLGKN